MDTLLHGVLGAALCSRTGCQAARGRWMLPAGGPSIDPVGGVVLRFAADKAAGIHFSLDFLAGTVR